MNEILNRRILVNGDKNGQGQTILAEVYSPRIAESAQPGQFIILRIREGGERIPLTVAGTDKVRGSVTIIFQSLGATTMGLAAIPVGGRILDFAGPLGRPSELDGYAGRRVAVIGGGLGCAIAYPQAKALHDGGAIVDVIVGFRNRDLVIIEQEMRAASTNFFLCTDDGSAGERGFVTDTLKNLIESGVQYDLVIAIGPPIMMKFVALLTQKHGIKTVVSLNPIMIDGTGMCGCCRVSIDGKTKFACVDGPDFDAQGVDFDELIRRNNQYKSSENRRREAECNLLSQ